MTTSRLGGAPEGSQEMCTDFNKGHYDNIIKSAKRKCYQLLAAGDLGSQKVSHIDLCHL